MSELWHLDIGASTSQHPPELPEALTHSGFLQKTQCKIALNCSNFPSYSTAKNNEHLSLYEAERDRSETLRAKTLCGL